jgi:hypothetical protein
MKGQARGAIVGRFTGVNPNREGRLPPAPRVETGFSSGRPGTWSAGRGSGAGDTVISGSRTV